jgi:predicted DNA-binding transcriptional regulator AlpA
VPRRFITYPELKPLKNIDFSRVHINRMTDAGTWPPAWRISENRIAWDEDEVDRFLATRPPAGEPVPVLWPPRITPRGWGQANTIGVTKPVGRPRGSRVIGGRLYRAEELAARGVGDDA